MSKTAFQKRILGMLAGTDGLTDEERKTIEVINFSDGSFLSVKPEDLDTPAPAEEMSESFREVFGRR